MKEITGIEIEKRRHIKKHYSNSNLSKNILDKDLSPLNLKSMEKDRKIKNEMRNSQNEDDKNSVNSKESEFSFMNEDIEIENISKKKIKSNEIS